jgi:hypothetical protein
MNIFFVRIWHVQQPYEQQIQLKLMCTTVDSAGILLAAGEDAAAMLLFIRMGTDAAAVSLVHCRRSWGLTGPIGEGGQAEWTVARWDRWWRQTLSVAEGCGARWPTSGMWPVERRDSNPLPSGGEARDEQCFVRGGTMITSSLCHQILFIGYCIIKSDPSIWK